MNDTADNLRRTACFVRNLACVERVELLAYHRLGVHSYAAAGKAYEMDEIQPPTVERMNALAELMRSENVPVRVGG
jgi:pyruvate formate lyase activating enzyme